MSLGDLVERAADTFDVTPRVWGNSQTVMDLVATVGGSGSSLIADAIGCGATAMVLGEVRYHDALSAMEAGMCVIEIGHDVSEWPLVSLLEEVVLSVDDLDPGIVHVLPPTPSWWTP
jgi:putative NIF3 family GTP cyclohydrolase 1 type 2